MRLFAIAVTPTDRDLVEDRCWQAGAAGIWEAAGSDGGLELRVGVDDADAAAMVAALTDRDPRDVTDIYAVDMPDRNVGIVVAGTTIGLRVPSTVFGDGHHPTTRTCLALAESLVGPGDRVLDVGCGAGALAVAAARLGALVSAIDIDPDAVEATATNARANGLVVEAMTTPVEDIDGVFDVVFANLSADTLLGMADRLVDLTGRALVVSGILADRWPSVRDGLSLVVQETRTTEGWVTAVLTPAGS